MTARATRSKSDALPLAELQAWMLEAICAPVGHSSEAIVRDGPRLSAADRLGIYRYAYRARLRECLRDDYPVLAATLGEARFAALCDEYVTLHPSRSPSLNAFGRHLADVCALSPGLDSPGFSADLAALEWALVDVTHAPTPVPVDVTELQRIPPDAWASARLVASEAVRLLTFDYPVNQHYQAYRDSGEVPPLPAARPSATVVYRRDVALWRRDLSPLMARVLGALLAGGPIAAALAEVGECEDAEARAGAERDIMTSFRDWLAGGLFTRVEWSSR